MKLTLNDYRRIKQQQLASIIPPRELCLVCWRPKGYCYCGKIRRFSPDIRFAILIHPLEEDRPIATGRMAHLCLKDSFLIRGEDFSECEKVNGLLADPGHYPVVLYPGKNSADLTTMTLQERRALFPLGKKPLIIAIDGTWNSARKTMFRSHNLRELPSIRFTPTTPSRIRVRHQPEKHCLTTIEAIHQVIELFQEHPDDRHHDNLLEVLDYMVGLQLACMGNPRRRDANPRIRQEMATPR